MRFVSGCILAGAGLVLAGCATPAQQAQNQENLLAAAGFRQLPANTPQRRNSLATLPPDKVVRTEHHGRIAYVFADPIACACLWVGTPQDWAQYQRERIRLHIADEQMAAAQMNENAAMNWSWGPWGPGWWW